MGIALKHAWNIAGKYALEPHGTVPRFLGTLGTVLSPGSDKGQHNMMYMGIGVKECV